MDEREPMSAREVDDLLREVAGRVHGAVDERERWELLLEAVVGMGADLSLDALLERIVLSAGRLVHARYVALGVLDPGHEKRLRTFVHHGMDAEVVREIGELPSGHGLLGLIIDNPEPLRLHDIASHPASFGFPPGHPPMHSFLGVPVRTKDKVFGNLYLTEHDGGADFSAQDERIVTALAAAAGVAIENAQLYEEVRRRERWLAASAEITTALVSDGEGERALKLVADAAREVAEADLAWIVSGRDGVDDGDFRLRAVSGADVDIEELRNLPTRHSMAAEVAMGGQPLYLEDLSNEPRASRVFDVRGWPAVGPAVFVPLRQSSGYRGVLALGWTHEHAFRQQGLDLALPTSFAEQAALSLQVAANHADKSRLALFEDRDRIGRDLHDVVIQRLFAVGLALDAAARKSGSPEIQAQLGAAVEELDGTIRDVRSTIFGLAATQTSTEVKAEVTRLVDRAAATLKFRPSLSFSGPIETLVDADTVVDLIAVLSEMLSNTVRHAQASSVQVSLSAGRTIELLVVDDGRGIPDDVRESGLRNMRRRAESRGGSCEVGADASGAGTSIRWWVPVRSRGTS